MTELCPICGSTEFNDYAGRPAAYCSVCGSLERHRSLAITCREELVPRGSGRCVELAPRSVQVFGQYLSDRGWHYVGVDRWDIRGRTEPEAFGSFIHHDADATDLGFAPSGSYELFIVQHVIEEVPDYPSALDEAARLLEPGGRALLEIPFDESRPDTVSRPPNRYANVWSFGRDLRDQLNARFDQVQEVELAEGLYRGLVFLCRRSP